MALKVARCRDVPKNLEGKLTKGLLIPPLPRGVQHQRCAAGTTPGVIKVPKDAPGAPNRGANISLTLGTKRVIYCKYWFLSCIRRIMFCSCHLNRKNLFLKITNFVLVFI